MKLSLTVTADDNSKTVKQLLKNKLHLSGRLIKQLKLSNRILLNSVPVHVNTPVKDGDLLEALVEFEEYNENITPEPMDLEILFEDENLIAINKPANMVVHPTFRHQSGTVANGLMHYLLSKGIKTLIRPVSRLDRDTSGIIIFALNPYIQHSLTRQIHDNSFTREYIGLVHGTFAENGGTISLPIKRVSGSTMLRHISPDGLMAITHYEVLERFSDISLLKFSLETGRTHQIRVHCQATGHPLIGDTLYPLPAFEGRYESLMSRHALHARRYVFTHPFSKKVIELNAPIPYDFSNALEILRNKQL
jgi:23S rRNA pseudouridine1911/1915/1917 synthase